MLVIYTFQGLKTRDLNWPDIVTVPEFVNKLFTPFYIGLFQYDQLNNFSLK